MRTKILSAGFAAALIALGAAGVAFADGHARSGTFTGLSNHVTKGEVSVVKTDDGYEIRLADSFWFDGAPDPRVGFGKDGKFVDATDFEPLREDSGAQVYKVPANLDPAEFDDVFVWCRRFSVPLGVASLN
ncbi:MAG: DM13 domain-containing protein [Pseudomonadota bacterium]